MKIKAELKSTTKALARKNKQLIKSENQNYKRVLKRKKELEATHQDHSFEYYHSEKNKLAENLNEIEGTQEDLRVIQANLNILSKKLRSFFWARVIGIMVSCGGAFTLAFLRIYDSLFKAVIFSITMMVLLLIISIISVYLKRNKKSDSNESHYSGITNGQIVFLIVSSLIICSFYPLSEYYSGYVEASSKNTFLIIDKDNALYAVLATDTDYMIAEKINYLDNNAIIYSDIKYVFTKENEPMLKTEKLDSPPTVNKGE